MPLNALRHVRKMRGGAQAHLLEADDGNFYVVKFRNNPQHRRILVNELLSIEILDYLKISASESAIIRVSPEFICANPDLHFALGTRSVPVESGWQFGSRYPGDPARTAVWDFLPDSLLPKVANLADFLAILVFDKWTANSDGRQCVFYRAMVRQGGGIASPGTPGFVARMIDNGFAFNGPNWDFPDSSVQGLYARRWVYERVGSLDDFEPWLGQVVNFPEEVIDRAWKRVPPAWIEGEEDALEMLLDRLFDRRRRIPDLISACRTGRSNPFPNWR